MPGMHYFIDLREMVSYLIRSYFDACSNRPFDLSDHGMGEKGLSNIPVATEQVIHVHGAWLSLVERSVRDRKVGGPNPPAPTITRHFGMSFHPVR